MCLQEVHGNAIECTQGLHRHHVHAQVFMNFGDRRDTGGTVILLPGRFAATDAPRYSHEIIVTGRVQQLRVSGPASDSLPPSLIIYNVHNFGISGDEMTKIEDRI
eukprot:7525207-Pyramimonas_sp.AAC.1